MKSQGRREPGPAVLSGTHFMSGDDACAEGALAAGCRFFAGYPITPSSEIAERMARRLPQVGGHYLQMEDEMASLAAVLGASWAGLKAMTATSGPGFSLMQENLGLAFMTETPCVVVDVQRGGPSTGLPTLTSQGDMMQARWGTHGDVEAVAFAPASPQEMFDLTIEAFRWSERLRMPVLVMADETVGHMTERVVIPPAEEVPPIERLRPDADVPPEAYRPFAASDSDSDGDGSLVPPMACAGEGFLLYVTGLTHDERGYPQIDAPSQARLVSRLIRKVRAHAEEILRYEAQSLDDAETVLIAYGSVARSAQAAVREARRLGERVGLLRLISVWPFPEGLIRELDCRRIVVAEANQGQIRREVERAARVPVYGVTHWGGELPAPAQILETLCPGSREKEAEAES